MGSNAKTYAAQCKSLGLSEAMGMLLEHWGGNLNIRGNANTLTALIRRGLVTPKQYGPNGYEHYYTREGIQMVNALRDYWGYLPLEHYHSTVREFLASTEPSNDRCGGEYELCREASKGLACSCPSVESPEAVETAEDASFMAPEFDRPEARECFYGCGSAVVAVFVDPAGVSQGLCETHRERVSVPTHNVPTQAVNAPQTGTESLLSYEDGTDTPSGILVGSVRIDGVDYDVKTDRVTTYQDPNTWSVTLIRKSDSACAWFSFPKGEDYRSARFYNVPKEGGISHPRTLVQAMREAIAWRLPNKPETEDETMTLDMLLSVTGKALDAASEALTSARPLTLAEIIPADKINEAVAMATENQEKTMTEPREYPTVCVVQERAGMTGVSHYHAPGCRDIAREARRYGASEGHGMYSYSFTSVAAIIAHEYADVEDGDWDAMIMHARDEYSGMRIMPCMGGYMPLGKAEDGRPLSDGDNGRNWSLVTVLDAQRCYVCQVHGDSSLPGKEIDGEWVCGFCASVDATPVKLSSHNLAYYVETEKKGIVFECGNCGSIDSRSNFARRACEGSGEESDGGFVETDSADDYAIVSRLSSGAGFHTAQESRKSPVTTDENGRQWVSYQHVLEMDDIVRAVGLTGTYRVHCLIPGLPVIYLDGGDGREPFPVDAKTVYAL